MAATISGIVFNDLNHNGTFNTGEPGIENAFVVLQDTGGTCISVQSDASGNYSFTNITVAGAYTLWETVETPGATCPPTNFSQPSGFNESTTPRQRDVTVTTTQINNNTTISGNNFGHDNLTSNGCTSFAYQVQGTPTTFTQIDLVTGGTINLGTLTPSSTFAGTGYNVIDGNFWGNNTTTGRVSRITANRTVTDLPAVPNLPVTTYNVGDVDADGHLYLYSSSGTSFFVIDVNSNRGTYGKLVDPANSFAEQTSAPFGVSISSAVNISDWAFNPQDGFLYSVGNTSGAVAKIDPVTGTLTALTTSPSTAGTYGASFFDNHNNLYEIENTNGQIFKYAISGTSATRSLFSTSVAASTNDGARCATAPLAFAQLNTTKTATPIVGVGDTITYTVTMNNVGNQSASNVVFLDTIPGGTTFISNSMQVNGVTIAGDPTPPTGIALGTLKIGVTTLSFKVVVVSVPNPNPTPNTAFGNFNFQDTGDTFTSTFISNVASTTINFATLDSTKLVNKAFANVGDTLNYTVVYTNVGNTTATNIIFIDTIPDGTTFVSGSLKQDGANVSGLPNPPGTTLPASILVGKTTTITFSVKVNATLPDINPIVNDSSATFNYAGNPSIPTIKSDSTTSNSVETQINAATLATMSKTVDKAFATCGDILLYTIELPNTGNVTAINVVIKDTIPNNTVLVANSVIVNGVQQIGANPATGVTIPNITPGATATLTFSVQVKC